MVSAKTSKSINASKYADGLGPSGFLLASELEELVESSQPQPGDILLLNGSSKRSKLNRIAQGGSRFSHVGMVVGSDLYIDAMPHRGVRISPIADLHKSKFNLKQSYVARNSNLIKSEKDVWNPALEYYERPYKLHSIFTGRYGYETQSGPVICSGLVASILTDLGLANVPVHKQLPKNIDELCQGNGWKRFPLCSYDVIASPETLDRSRRGYTLFWLEAIEPLHKSNKSFRRALQSLSRMKDKR